ncbi:hypothetical protein FGO68_gene17696 [Halteria grandinella]|uniref:Uncharacterized protein n=1 Tax=Halteria grandinella TaxID=5974 RepID=A0A8J8NIB6_HALGN|nr:hypothetical protein FGO68_gene17696 [Halteria grandinella]
MNYQQIQKLPRYVNSQKVKAHNAKPKQMDRKYQDMDIFAIYQRQAAGGQQAPPGTQSRRLDADERAAYVKAQKEKLGLNERVLSLSSKRSVWNGQLRQDMPHLEFTQYFKNQHGLHIFKPHEMQWSLDQFLERMVDTRDENDARIEKRLNQSYEQASRVLKRIEEMSDQTQADEKTESLKQTLKELAGNADLEKEDLKGNKIF